jgi:L-ascorbate metabolism protein UlaG (beta-lactamase superfamily)
MKITYYGHSCFGVEIMGKHLLFDPFITGNSLAAHIDISTIPADLILVSHGHGDHTGDTAAIAKRTGATVAAVYEVTNWLEGQGVKKTHPMNIGGKWIVENIKIKCVNAVHSSSMPDGSYGGNPMGFVVECDEGNFYYAGDTALTYDMKLIGEYRNVRFAFLPIGDTFTMSVDNALIASDFIACRDIIGMHYDTMPAIRIDHEDAVRKFSRAGKKLTLMKIGETIEK